jgi:hypothetical protein
LISEASLDWARERQARLAASARNYSFAIEDLEDEGPKPAAEERLRAPLLTVGVLGCGLHEP